MGWPAAVRQVCAAYRERHGRLPGLLRPRRYSEKMQWRKLFDFNPGYTVFCDKLAVRDFIAARLGPAVLTPLLWAGDNADDIPFAALAPPYVLKSSHACGHTEIVKAGTVADAPALRATARWWLGHCHGAGMNENGYRAVPHRLMVERLVTAPDGTPPLERRFFMFDGKVGVINTVFVEDGVVRNGAFHTPAWQRLGWHFNRFVPGDFAVPPRLAEMMAAAQLLAAGHEHLRVDIFDAGERFWVGEVTVYAWSGLSVFNPDQADFQLGALWRLARPWRRAVATMLAYGADGARRAAQIPPPARSRIGPGAGAAAAPPVPGR